jgi:orotate phosphoribosyltransferase
MSENFVDFCIECKVLLFGDFTLKSGLKSTVFFNAGLFNSGDKIQKLGEFYADCIVNSGIEFDVIFGPAYKGIPLAVCTSIALYEKYKISKPYAFNRKEIKDHGEGGSIVGGSMKGGRVLIVDDVITAGTAIKESLRVIENAGGKTVGVVIALDREEIVDGRDAAEEVRKAVKITSIAKMSDIMRRREEGG